MRNILQLSSWANGRGLLLVVGSSRGLAGVVSVRNGDGVRGALMWLIFFFIGFLLIIIAAKVVFR